MTYKFLEHTADVKFRASGDSIEAAFISSFDALKETISGNIVIKEEIKKEMNIVGEDLNNLLYKFLEEFLFLLDSQDFLASRLINLKINREEKTLSATILGDKAQKYDFTNDVKAITYNGMVIKEEKGQWIVEVVLDV